MRNDTHNEHHHETEDSASYSDHHNRHHTLRASIRSHQARSNSPRSPARSGSKAFEAEGAPDFDVCAARQAPSVVGARPEL